MNASSIEISYKGVQFGEPAHYRILRSWSTGLSLEFIEVTAQ